MSSFTSKIGDTFETLSLRIYGFSEKEGVLRAANPGVLEPIPVGTTVFAPLLNRTTTKNTTPSVTVFIDGKQWSFWENINISESIDSISTVTLDGPFLKGFVPFQFNQIEVFDSNLLVFTGTLVSVTNNVTDGSQRTSISAYSSPGVLMDCTASASAYPIEFNQRSLQSIASKLCAPFGVGVIFQDGPGPVFERVALEPEVKIFEFLSDLAKQRGLIITDNAQGQLVFFKPVQTSPVAKLLQGQPPLVSVSSNFNPQLFYSSITGLAPTVVGSTGENFTVRNPFLQGVLRPLTFTSEDTENNTLPASVKAKASRMFANAANFTATVVGWENAQGARWQKGQFVTLEAPSANVPESFTFLIKSVNLEKSTAGQVATLTLALPSSFTNNLPESVPWG